jgi:putative CocE/NonD family hydrolase
VWGAGGAALDRNDVCAAEGARGFKCWRDRQVLPGVKRVDADPRGKHLAQLVKQHRNFDVAASVGKVEFRDDALELASGTIRFADVSPYGLRRQIESSGVPMMVWCGWMDASPCEGALIRYRTFSNPQLMVIGPLSHGDSFNGDPFAKSHRPAVPPVKEQWKMEADFFDQLLRRDPPEKIESSIRYYTMGEGAWHTTRVWPPAGSSAARLYFADGNALTASAPAAAAASDSYTVDFTASSGKLTRWHTQLGGDDVV